jgi:hypothetical protein
MVSTWNRTESEQTRTRSESMRCERATVACDRGSEKAEACLTGRATDSQINATNSGCYARSGKRRSVIGVVMLSRRRVPFLETSVKRGWLVFTTIPERRTHERPLRRG